VREKNWFLRFFNLGAIELNYHASLRNFFVTAGCDRERTISRLALKLLKWLLASCDLLDFRLSEG